MTKQIRIAIPLIQQELNGGSGWIAGFYFIKNIINAFTTLSVLNIPDIIIFVPENFHESFTLNDNDLPWLKIITISNTSLNDYDAIEKVIDSYQCDVFFPFTTLPIFHFNGKALAWIPDFQDRHLPHYFARDEIKFRKSSADFVLSYCENALCTSLDVSKDLKHFYPDYENKARVVHFRSFLSDKLLAINPQSTLNELNIHEKYVYLPNQFWMHKNHQIVFEAWKILQTKNLNYLLVCTGSSSDYRNPDYYEGLISYIKKNKLENQIRILGFIDREKQVQLYRGASAVLQPSLFEGWSTSIEDAKALGKQLIVSNIPVHQEQCTQNAIYFDAHNAIDLAEKIETIWDKLPEGYDNFLEVTARKNYQIYIQKFARELINLLYETAGSQGIDKSPTLALPVLFHRTCVERLNVINQLNTEIEKINKENLCLNDEINKLNNEISTLNKTLYVRKKNKLKRLLQKIKGKLYKA